MPKLFYLNCLLNNIDIRLSCHQANNALALVTQNNEIVFCRLNNKSQLEIKSIPWIKQNNKRIEAICLNPTADWLLIITEDNSLYVVSTFRSAEKNHQIHLKWSKSDVTTITENVLDKNYTKPLKLLWWQRKNLSQNAFIGYEDGTIRLVSLENGSCLDTCKVKDRIRSLNLDHNERSNETSLLVQGESGQKWRSILKRQFIGFVWERGMNSKKPIHFQPFQLVIDEIPDLSPFKCCIICEITEESHFLIDASREEDFNSGELDLSVDILQAHFSFSKNERVFHVYKIMDVDYFHDKNDYKASNGLQPIFPLLIEDVILSKPSIKGYLVVTNIGVYKVTLSSFIIDKLIDLVINENLQLAAKLAIIFGLNFMKLLESCGDLMIAHGAINDGLKMYENARIDPLNQISKIATNDEALLKFSQMHLTTNKDKIAIKTKIYVTNLIVMAYVRIISQPDKEFKYEDDFENFIRHQEFYDPNLIFDVMCKFELWPMVFFLATTHGFQNELVAALSETVASYPPFNDTDFFIILSEPSLTQSLLVQPKYCTTILRYVRSNLRKFPPGILRRFVNQLDLSKNCNVCETTIEDQLDHRREMIEVFILLVMQLVDQTPISFFGNIANLLQKRKPAEELQNRKKFHNFSTLSCGYGFVAVVRNDNVYTMGKSTSGSLGFGPTEKRYSPPKLVHTLEAMNVIVWSVSCGRNHTLALTNSGVFSWGSNAYGQLGISALNRQSPYPTLVSSLEDEHIVDVVAGQYHSMVLTASGLVYTWGWGLHGQLGHGTSNNEWIPKLLIFNHSIVKIAAGYAHSLILTSEGKIYGFGSNIYGQLAKDNLYGNKSSIPIQIVLLCNMYIPFRDIASGYFQSVAIREKDELLYTWGTTPTYVNSYRSKSKNKRKPSKKWKSPMCINTGSSTSPIEKIAVGLHHIVILRHGKLHVCKNMEEKFTEIETNEQIQCGKFISVSCGSDFTLARSKTGRLFVWGSDMVARTLMGKSYDNMKKLPSFQSHLDLNPVEVLGLPSIIITYHPVDHSFKFPKSILKSICGKTENSEYKFDQVTLLYILETYFGYYDSQNIIQECLNMNNLQAASKVAILNNKFEDSFGYQLRAMKTGKFCFGEIREDNLEALKILGNLVEFYIECTFLLECKSHINSIINMGVEFWINNNLPVANFEDILLKNVDKLSTTLFNLVFCEHVNNNLHEEMNVNEDDDNKLKNHQVLRFFNSCSTKFKLQLCSSIINVDQ